jgi:hypothetical protein
MTRERPVRIREGGEVRSLSATRLMILAANEPAANRALKDMEHLLRARGLALNSDKTRILPPGEAFMFLGQVMQSGRHMPPLVANGPG